MVETEGEGITHYRIAALWMGIVPIIGLIFWLADSTGDINETINGCSTWGWGSCPPKPPGYDMPRTIMLFYLVILGIYALSKNDFEENKTRRYGIAYGMGFGYLIYVLAWANGMF